MTDAPKPDQIWKENDPRQERMVKVVSVNTPHGVVKIQAVGKNKYGHNFPIKEAQLSRFNGKAGGYSLVLAK